MPRFAFKNEEELEDYIESVLKARGVPIERPRRSAPSGTERRPSIITPDAIIEPSRELTVDKIYYNLGQAVTYARIWGKSRIMIVGQSPVEPPGEDKKAQHLKEAIESPPRGRFSGRIEIIFIDKDPSWIPRPVVQQFGVVGITLSIIAVLLLLTVGLNFANQGFYIYQSAPPPQPQPQLPPPRIKCYLPAPNC